MFLRIISAGKLFFYKIIVLKNFIKNNIACILSLCYTLVRDIKTYIGKKFYFCATFNTFETYIK